MRPRAMGLIVFIFITLLVSAPEATAGLNLYIDDTPVTLDVPLMVVNGTILLPLRVLSDHLEAVVEWSPQERKAVVRFPSHTMSMRVGSVDVQVDREKTVMEVAPELQEGKMMVPLRFIADVLGMRMEFDADRMALILISPEQRDRPDLRVPDEDPRQLRDISYLGGTRSRVFIDVRDYGGYESVLLTRPDRLVIDLVGVRGDALPDQSIDGTIIQRIRTSRFDDRTMRLVFDLNRSTGYEIHQIPEGGLEVAFNYQIGEVGFERDDDEARLWFVANEQPPYQVIHLVEPDRLVVDLQNSTLLDGAKEMHLDDEVVRLLRVSQFQPSITRIVLELNSPLTPLLDRETSDRYELSLFAGTPQEAARFAASTLADPDEELDSLDRGVEIARGDESTLLRNRIIAIDPGHGGSDPGAIGPRGTFEKDVALTISLKLGRLLADAGARVVYTRDSDVYVSVFERPRIAERAGAEMLISIHANSYIRQVARGTETLYSPTRLSNFELAKHIQAGVVDRIRLIDRGLRPRTDLAVLNNSTIPTVLLEVAFINHPEEENLLRSSSFQLATAEGVLRGIVDYLQSQ